MQIPEQNKILTASILMSSIGVLLLGISSIIFVLLGPPLTATERFQENIADKMFESIQNKKNKISPERKALLLKQSIISASNKNE